MSNFSSRNFSELEVAPTIILQLNTHLCLTRQDFNKFECCWLWQVKDKREKIVIPYLAREDTSIWKYLWMLVICSSVLCSAFKHRVTAISLISPPSCLKGNIPYCMQISYPHILHHPLSSWSPHHTSLSTENCLVYLRTGVRHRWYCSPRIRQRLSSKIITKKIKHNAVINIVKCIWNDLTWLFVCCNVHFQKYYGHEVSRYGVSWNPNWKGRIKQE